MVAHVNFKRLTLKMFQQAALFARRYGEARFTTTVVGRGPWFEQRPWRQMKKAAAHSTAVTITKNLSKQPSIPLSFPSTVALSAQQQKKISIRKLRVRQQRSYRTALTL
jgi:hypothetical protein